MGSDDEQDETGATAVERAPGRGLKLTRVVTVS